MAASIRLHERHVFRRISRLLRCSETKWTTVSCQSTATNVLQRESPEYPPVKPRYPPGKWGDMIEWKCWKMHDWGQEMLAIPKVKERLEKIAGEKKRYMQLLEPFTMWPADLEYKQFMTKTHVINGLPDLYASMNVDAEMALVKPLIIDAIVQESDMQYKHKLHDNIMQQQNGKVNTYKSHHLWGQITSIILSGLSTNNEHLHRSQYDENVRVETFLQRLCAVEEEKEEDDDDDSERKRKPLWPEMRMAQLRHKTNHQIRTELPLPQFLEMDDEICIEGKYPKIEYKGKVAGQKVVHDRPITVSGHWVADPCEFGQVSIHTMPAKYEQFCRDFDEKSIDQLWQGFGLTASFGWCAAQAHNQGFNLYHDTTYPFTTQTVVVDDNNVRFFTYQLNTLHMWKDDLANPLRNVLWATDTAQLFDSVEGGEVKGFNDEVLQQILKFFTLKPVDRGVDLRPYLTEEEAPVSQRRLINLKGEEPIERPPIGRWQYPRNAVYF